MAALREGGRTILILGRGGHRHLRDVDADGVAGTAVVDDDVTTSDEQQDNNDDGDDHAGTDTAVSSTAISDYCFAISHLALLLGEDGTQRLTRPRVPSSRRPAEETWCRSLGTGWKTVDFTIGCM